LGLFPLHQIAHVGVNVSRDLKIFGREIIFEVSGTSYSKLYEKKTYFSVTDGQTSETTVKKFK